jgi:NNP family nitrate/nitrite transporter-like MFS transporter
VKVARRSQEGHIVSRRFYFLLLFLRIFAARQIVPYVDPPATGSISGIVGAGGNVGAACFLLGFRQLAPKYAPAFVIMGAVVLASSVLTAFINIKGYGTLFYGKDDAPKQTLTVPEKLDDSDAEEIQL